jgi:hypothetical protein
LIEREQCDEDIDVNLISKKLTTSHTPISELMPPAVNSLIETPHAQCGSPHALPLTSCCDAAYGLAGIYTALVLANGQLVFTEKSRPAVSKMKLPTTILQAVLVATATCQSLQAATGTSNAPIIDLGYVGLPHLYKVFLLVLTGEIRSNMLAIKMLLLVSTTIEASPMRKATSIPAKSSAY